MAGLSSNTSAFIRNASEYAQKAAHHDQLACKQNDPQAFQNAKDNYIRAIDYYMVALKYETNENVRANLRQKLQYCLERGETMKERLKQHEAMLATGSSISFQHSIRPQPHPASGANTFRSDMPFGMGNETSTSVPFENSPGQEHQTHMGANGLRGGIQLEMLNTTQLVHMGTEHALKAIRHDELACREKDGVHFQLAKAFYTDALQCYMAALRIERNERVKQALREKITAYLDRAELMGMWLERYSITQAPMQTGAIINEALSHAQNAIEYEKRACRGNNPEDFQTATNEYLVAIKLYKTVLAHEQNERMKQALREKISSYSERVEIMKGWLENYNMMKSNVISDVTGSSSSTRHDDEAGAANELLKTIGNVNIDSSLPKLDVRDAMDKEQGYKNRGMTETSTDLNSLKIMDMDGNSLSEIRDHLRTFK